MFQSGHTYDKYINGIIGGLIMSISSSLHFLLKGKITGISGTLFRTITLGDLSYNLCFLSGMLLIPSLIRGFTKKSFYGRMLEEPIKYTDSLSIIGFLISGFLVGFGTKMANGCTSGHGVCGLPRLSKRSFAAVGTFLLFGIVFATLRYYVKFLETDFILSKKRKDSIILSEITTKIISIIFFCLSIIIILLIFYFDILKKKIYDFKEILIPFFVGVLFSLGLMESGMAQRHRVLLFLSICKNWDPTLMCVLGAAVGLNLITFNLMLKKMEKPIFHKKFQLPDKTEIDRKLIVGAAIFGIGWGFGGICPGPGFLCFFIYLPQSITFMVMLSLGQFLEYKLDKKIVDILNGTKKENKENKEKKEKTKKEKNEKTDDSIDGQIKISRFNERSIMNDSEIKVIKIKNKYINQI